MKQKGFGALIIILAIVVAGLVSIGGYYLIKPATIQPALPPPDETANWKTYISSSGKFLLKYPDVYTLHENKVPLGGDVFIPRNNIVLLETVTTGISTKDNRYPYQFAISFEKKDQDFNLESYLNNYPTCAGSDASFKKDQQPFSTGDKQGVLIYNYCTQGNGDVDIFVVHNQHLYIISTAIDETTFPGFKKILSTFEFVDLDVRVKADIKIIQVALEQYFDDNNHYPSTLQEISPVYFKEIPHNPYDNSEYLYRVFNTSYELSGKLGDGSEYKVSAWKTYSNADYGFSVEYPPLFSYSKQTLPPGDIFLFQVRFGSAKEQKFNYQDGFSIEVTEPETLKGEVEYREWRVVGHLADKINKKTDITKDGYKGVKLEYTISSDNLTGKKDFVIVIIKTNKYAYTIESNVDLIDQILSNFKILNQLTPL